MHSSAPTRALTALRLLAVSAVGLGAAVTATPARADTILKIGTLAPEGSTWWKIFQDAAAEIKEKTGGEVKVRLYAGGSVGDETDMVRKMRVGRLQGAAITSVGLADIQPALLVLQAPGLFQGWNELDHARTVMKDRFASLLDEKGFKVFLWGDVGFNRVFANVRVEKPSDLSSTKPWCWTQDGVYQAYYKTMGINPVLTGVPDVLPSLQTGRLDAYSTPPLAGVSFQWFKYSKFMLDLPQNVTIGAVVLTHAALEKLTDDQRGVLTAIGSKYAPRLAEAVRADNDKSLDALRTAGLQIITPSADARKAWADVATKGADAAVGAVYPKELLDEVRKVVADYRASGGK